MAHPGDDLLALKAPTLEEFERLAEEAFARLPRAFRDLAANVIVRVDDWPDEETLAELEAESEYDLLGLFRGIGLAETGEPMSGQFPNMIWLYRRPILDYWAENDETLGAIIAHVLIHEIGHHFGLSDEDMEAIEAQAG
ncbi:MAG: metallopeptidase family protein [Salinarimonas sp.]